MKSDFKLVTEEYAAPDGRIHVRIRKITESHNFVISEETLTVLKGSRQHLDHIINKKIITEFDKPIVKKAIPCAHFAIWNKTKHYYQAVPCKKWTCAYCARIKYQEIRRRMNFSEANSWRERTHIMITLEDPEDNNILFEALNDWTTFTKRGGTFEYKIKSSRWGDQGKTETITIKARPDLKYIWSLEVQHKRYLKYDQIVWHLHIVINKRLGHTESEGKKEVFPIFNHALKLHGSKSDYNTVRITYPNAFQSGDYLLKYFTKEEYQILLEKGAKNIKRKRRWSCSRYKDREGKWHSIVPSAKEMKEREKQRRLKLDPWYVPDEWVFMTIEEARKCLKDYEFNPEAWDDDYAYYYRFVRKKARKKSAKQPMLLQF